MTETNREFIENLTHAYQNAQETQKTELERVRVETQVAIDASYTQVNDAVHQNMLRYHAFKVKLLEDGKKRGHNLGKEVFGYFYSTDPQTFFVDSISDYYGGTLVFISEAHDRNATIGVPLDYFNDPEAWEYKFITWVDEVVEMTEKANAIWTDAKYRANNVGFDPMGDSFRLQSSVNVHNYPTLRVDFGTGSVYAPNEPTPIACLR